MSTQWITDRLPTAEDAPWPSYRVWITTESNSVMLCHWRNVESGNPWQRIQYPAPYVSLKRWSLHSLDNAWILRDTDNCCSLPSCSREAAQRIEDVFNEVMP